MKRVIIFSAINLLSIKRELITNIVDGETKKYFREDGDKKNSPS